MASSDPTCTAPPAPRTPLLSPLLPPECTSVTLRGEEGVPVVRLDGFFSRSECAALIDALSPLLPTRDDSASSRRQRLQADLIDSPLIETIWARLAAAKSLSPDVKTLLNTFVVAADDSDIDDARLMGAWTADHLRQRLLFAGYGSKDFFGAHFDMRIDDSGKKIFDDNNGATPLPEFVSHITFLLYLNEFGADFTGGSTNILRFPCKMREELVDGCLRSVAADEGILARIEPSAGTVLLFLQEKVWHEAGSVDAGQKFILRTDIMYRRG